MINLFTAIKEYAGAEKTAHWIYVDIDGRFPFIKTYIRNNATGLLMCNSGYADIEIDFKRYHIERSDMLLLIDEHVLRIETVSDDFKGCCVIADDIMWKEIWREMERMAPFYSSAKEMPKLGTDHTQERMMLRYFEMIKDKYMLSPGPYNSIIEKKLFSALIYEVSCMHMQIQTQIPVADKKERLLQQFLRLVSIHFRKERRIGFYASFFKVSPKYLSFIVRQKSGMTAVEWIDNYVVTEVCVLLRTTNMSVKEIADGLNFPDQSFLGKYFKRHVGVTPKEYRKQKI